jgi:hydrogenase maturation protease
VQKRIRVLGLGNILRSDEGLGVWAIKRLVNDSRIADLVSLVDGGTLGLELLSYAAGVERLLAIDCIDLGLVPGTLIRLNGPDLQRLPRGASVHELGLADLLGAMRLMDRAPRETVLMGVQPATLELGIRLSPRVAAGLERLLATHPRRSSGRPAPQHSSSRHESRPDQAPPRRWVFEWRWVPRIR